MSLTLIKRPLGHKLNYTDITAEIIDDGTGDALVYTGSAHGLSDGDYVYIESNIDSYNGFKYVDQIAYDSFKIKNSENGDLIEWIQDADISYRTSVLNHGWQSVHLPIVYELQSDLWPNNVAEEAYVPNTIDSFSNSNGYVQLNLDQAVAGVTVRNWLELVGNNDLAGPYQIIAVTAPWSIVINLAYDAGLSFTGLQVVNYYNNYAVNVEVWAGLDAAHRWAAYKPYELATTLKLTPDSEGKVKFSINEILRGYVKTRNNLTLDTLPNNTEFHTSFFIKYYESYDQSDGTDVSTFNGSVTSDAFEGQAVNSMMPFRSLNSGFMSDYVNEGSFLARWLTLFDIPTMFVDRFFDLSFIMQLSGFDVVITIFKSINNVVTDTEVITIENPGAGIIRVPIIPEVGFDKYCIQAAITGSGTFPLAQFENNPGADEDWTEGANPSISFASSPAASDILFINYPFIDGAAYTITTLFTASVVVGSFNVKIYDDSFNILESESSNITSDTNTLSFTAGADASKIGINVIVGATGNVNIVSMAYVIDAHNITEQICCNVVQECETSMVNDNLRLTEGSQLRELE